MGEPTSAGAAASATKAERISAKERARIRTSLRRQVRRNPGVITSKGFAHKADLVDFKLPMAIRLGRSNGVGGYEPSDDELEITWDDSVDPWPLTGGAPAAPQTTMLAGRFTMEADFGGDSTGSGELGSVETAQGLGLAMTATPFAISEFDPLCPTDTQLAVDPGANIAISTAGARFGLLNMFGQTIRGSLALRMTFASRATASCGGASALTPVVDNSAALPMPIRFNGRFSVSPAITADGKIRFGRMTIDDAVTPQVPTFAYLRACTGVITCDPQQFAAHLKVKKLTAEVLLGDIGP
jgi:hypothetical protein